MKAACYTLLCVFACGCFCYAQTIEGTVIDAKTLEPVMGAAVYIDGTTTGVATGQNGNFKLEYPATVSTPLVVRMLGYETRQFTKPLETNLTTIKLVEKLAELDAVMLFTDPWSRERKENIFKYHFIGKTADPKSCTILNLSDVKLVFNPYTAILEASIDVLVLVENKYLGYLIEVDLKKFNMNYNKLDTTIIRNVTGKNPQVYSLSPYLLEGNMTYLFKELGAKKSSIKKRLENREELYIVSTLYFYRALCGNRLEKAGFTLYYNDVKVQVKEHIRVTKINSFYKIDFRHEVYLLKDKSGNTTIIAPLFLSGYMTYDGYLIDEHATATNRTPFITRGYFAKLGVASKLPSDYLPE
jgi:hypothetical protein